MKIKSKLFWYNTKLLVKTPSLIATAALTIVSSVSLSIMLMINFRNSDLAFAKINSFVNLFIVKFILQILLYGCFQVLVVFDLFNKQLENGKINLELRSGQTPRQIYWDKLLLTLFLGFSLLATNFLLDCLLSFWGVYNYMFIRVLYSYLFLGLLIILVSTVSITTMTGLKMIASLIVSISFVITVGFSQISGGIIVNTSKEKLSQFSNLAPLTNLETYYSWEFYKTIKLSQAQEDLQQFYKFLEIQDSSDEYFTMTQLPEQLPEVVLVINEIFKDNSDYKITIQNTDSSFLPFNTPKNFDFEAYHKRKMRSAIDYLVTNYQNNFSNHNYLPMFKFIQDNIKDFEKVFNLSNGFMDEGFYPFSRIDYRKKYEFEPELWQFYNNSYGAVFSSWIVLNLGKSVYSVSNDLISFIYKYDNQFSPIVKTHLILNPLVQFSQMGFGATNPRVIDDIYKTNMSAFWYYNFVNTQIKVKYKENSTAKLHKMITGDSGPLVKDGLQLDFGSEVDDIISYYDLVNNLKVTEVVPIWAMYIEYITISLVLIIIGKYSFKKTVFN
ncbi:hypothetical protein SSABA_v1c09090 [Spiroplasma sabaudiense Ar-1343]|uniref:Uncharacterized protein n=1 Tax=Spiroplasma sabaudiense Ar-1343 TaxID=1276257 RepID=W6AAW4_9MOLU|nr:hypothetical protein [Spiroplasma sabaudiense]AHI54308.1 hypothetical protein SSABA_v1c09090 [Spiroplasma sabaudiense Ar-1343]